MKNFTVITMCATFLCGCTALSYQERNTLKNLEKHGISVDKPIGVWEKPANPSTAGLLNLLPGVGNFYLAYGNGADSSHYVVGALNLLLWPISIIWGVPEAVIDANTINKRELVYYYTFDDNGINVLKKRGYEMNAQGSIKELR